MFIIVLLLIIIGLLIQPRIPKYEEIKITYKYIVGEPIIKEYILDENTIFLCEEGVSYTIYEYSKILVFYWQPKNDGKVCLIQQTQKVRIQ